MASEGQSRIGGWMAGVVAIGVVLLLVLTPRANGPASILVGGVGIVVVLLLVAVWLVEAALGVTCPNCRERTMDRVAIDSFRDRFYRCRHCGVLARRGLFLGWSDASGPEHAEYYARHSQLDPWSPRPPGNEADDSGPPPESPTHTALLRGKRSRNPHALDPETGLPTAPDTPDTLRG